MNISEMLEHDKLWERRIILVYGPRENMTDCENDIILINAYTKKIKRFHGTFYDTNYCKSIRKWINQSAINNEQITAETILEFQNLSLTDLSNIYEIENYK